MLAEIVNELNWVDIFVLIVLLRTCYIALKSNLPTEAFKLLGTIFAVYLSFHYFTLISDYIGGTTRIEEKMPLQFLDFLSFVFLFFVGYAIFVVIRELVGKGIKTEAIPHLNRWGAFILGILRAFLLASVILFALLISSISYFSSSTAQSYSGTRIGRVAPSLYKFIWNNLMSMIMSQEDYNETIDEVFSGPKES